MNPPESDLRLRAVGDAVEFDVKVVPGASRSRLAGTWNQALRLTVRAAAERGRANEEVLRLLSEILGVAARDVAVVAGQARPLKTIRVRGLGTAAARERIGRALAPPAG